VLIRSLRRRPRDVAWLAVWSAVQSLPALASGWVLAEAAGAFLAGRTLDGLRWLGLLALAALVGALGTRQSYLRLGAVVEPLRDELVELIVAGSLARSMDTTRPPDTDAVARMTHQAEIVRDAFAGLLTVACTFAFTAGSTLAGLLTLVPATLPYVIPPLLVSVLILRLLLRPFAARQRRAVVGEEAVANSAAKAVSGLRDVTSCGAEAQVFAQFDAVVSQQADAARSVARIGSARLLCLAAGGWLPLLLVLAAAPSMLHGGVTPAHIIGAIGYIGGSLRGTLNTLSQGVGAGLVRLTVTLDRIVDASTPPAEPPGAASPPAPHAARGAHARHDGHDARDGRDGRDGRDARGGHAARNGHPVRGRHAARRESGGLRLRGLGFGYGAQAEPVISDLSIDIAPGDHLAIVGPSGIGKSSLAGLLAGMLRPTAGEILLDGVPMARYPAAALTRLRVLIPQEAYVFTGTLAENILYLRGTADPPPGAGLDAAADALGLSPLVSRLGGYHAVIDPAALSAGERQLIAITRAYLSTAPIAILDEASCHLDPAAEARAEAAFARRPGTLIVIAHRISSALRARRVLVLDGVRAQVGDHASLLAGSSMYRDLAGYWSVASQQETPGLEPSGR
jgi:ATP-binding cassette, subfamily C, bacterial